MATSVVGRPVDRVNVDGPKTVTRSSTLDCAQRVRLEQQSSERKTRDEKDGIGESESILFGVRRVDGHACVVPAQRLALLSASGGQFHRTARDGVRAGRHKIRNSSDQ